MTITVKTPPLPESVNDATVITWHRQVGEHVTQDENLVDLETDKVVLEVPAPESGVLTEIHQPAGSVVVADVALGRIEPGAAAITEESPHPEEAQSTPQTDSATTFASPSVRQQLLANQLSSDDVPASGRKNHILKEDVSAHLQQSETLSPPQDTPDSGGEREERKVPMTRLRARMAERLLSAQQNAAILTTFNEVDMQAVIELRKRYKTRFEETHNVRLGFMSFFVSACLQGLKKFPEINASIDGTDVIYHGYYDIGVAVSSQRGLVVPIVRNVDQLSLADIEHQIVDLATRAQKNKLTMDDLTGGTFTISNGGVFGSLLSTPIINPPQTGILGMHKIEKRPVVVDDAIVIRPMMYLALSYDHRLVDGETAVRFLGTVKDLIEDPSRLLLQI
ncbi:MAG TPA: 2-oxoglutarate dehydrogenase complex dihydrolipoyllysine-residue succinyltransferase [Gammaproteobacteria bacterium]|nr:2-oxoglutarate dehydrogenase complex dihydrolipoyllysine-residue succinyltransferase [Gammaproteobacteria bacterium]